MSTDRETTRIVRSWLEEGATALPDRVLDTVLDQLPATRQRRAWWPARRLPLMSTPFRIALAAAAVVVVALFAINLVPRSTDVVGGVSPTPVPTAPAAIAPVPTATAASTPAPTVTAAPTPAPTPAPTLPPSGQIAPGTYRVDFMTYTLPAGWSSFQGIGASKPDGAFIDPWRGIATVYRDPCHWQTPAVSVGPTVDNLVAALVAQKRGSKVTPVDVTIDGFHGKQIDLIVPLDLKIAACDQATYKLWTDVNGGDRYNQGPGQHDLLDILDVNGQTLVIDRVFYAANKAADLAGLQAIVDSIKITP